LRRAAEALDFGQPAAVLLLGVLHLIQDSEDPRGIVRGSITGSGLDGLPGWDSR
jgi:hypothetical protein